MNAAVAAPDPQLCVRVGCGHPSDAHKSGGRCITVGCYCVDLRLPGWVEGVIVPGVVAPHVLSTYRRKRWPLPTLAVEPTNPGDDTVSIWGHVAGAEQRGIGLDVVGVAALIAALAQRMPVLGPAVDMAALVDAAAAADLAEILNTDPPTPGELPQ